MKIHNVTCTNCGDSLRQVKSGARSGRQRYKCLICGHRYTLQKVERGVPEEIREKARTLAKQGERTSAIARQLGVSSQSVANWLKQAGIDHSSRQRSSVEKQDEVIRRPSESAPARRQPTIADVAALSGVSVASVSNFVKGKGRFKDTTRERIQSAIDELHFVPNALMRGILHGRTNIIGVMMFDLSTLGDHVGATVAPLILAGISSAAYDAGRHILLYSGLQRDKDGFAISELLNRMIDGMIWVARESTEDALERLAATGLPTVAMQDRCAPKGIGFVDADNRTGMKMLIKHLRDLGHKRIAYAGSLHSTNFRDRAEGYRLGLEATGLPFDPALEAIGDEFRFQREAWDAVIDRWLALPAPPTAIMTPTDLAAAQAIDLLVQRGLRIPEDIAVTGFDDAPDARWIGGGLTTIRQPFNAMGREAVTGLLKIIEGDSSENCQLTMPVELIARATTIGAKIRYL